MSLPSADRRGLAAPLAPLLLLALLPGCEAGAKQKLELFVLMMLGLPVLLAQLLTCTIVWGRAPGWGLVPVGVFTALGIAGGAEALHVLNQAPDSVRHAVASESYSLTAVVSFCIVACGIGAFGRAWDALPPPPSYLDPDLLPKRRGGVAFIVVASVAYAAILIGGATLQL